MANISTVYGDYTFEFEYTGTSANEQLTWLKQLSDLLSKDVEYGTYFLGIDELTEIEQNMQILRFFGAGRWTYDNNVEWFKTSDDLKAHLLKMKDLQIDISFKEYEEGEGFVARGVYTLKVSDNDVDITKVYEAVDDFNKSNFIGWEFGSADDWDEQFGELAG